MLIRYQLSVIRYWTWRKSSPKVRRTPLEKTDNIMVPSLAISRTSFGEDSNQALRYLNLAGNTRTRR